MAARHVAVMLSILALAFALAACGGSGATLNPASNHSVDQAFQNWLASVELTAPASGKVDGLPSIPMDSPSDKGAASVSDPVVKLGADHLQAYNYTDDGTAVRLEAPAHGGEDNPPLAYALYKVGGLTGLHPTIMDVEAVPAMLGDNYFIGVADYTTMHWQWFGPYDLPEVEIDLTNHNHRYISESGNLYFLVVTHEGMGCTHAQTTLYFGDGDGNRLPGAPYGLQASDGAIADAVGLAWIAGPHSGSFEIYRALAGDANGGMPPPHGDWALIGTSLEPNYLDHAVDRGVVYLYKVRALNDFGASGFSNVDSGFAGEAPPPPDGFRIHGWIRTAAADGTVGEPISHVLVTLLGPPQPLTIYTNADGAYSFEGLPQGKFIVVPQDPQMFFDPVYGATIVGPDHPVAEINFTSTGELPMHRIWGFVYSLDASDPGMPPIFHPMPDVAVNVALGDGSGTPVTVMTNDDGYYIAMELPVGMYVVTPGLAGWHFDPAAREVHVTGEAVTPMANFVGVPDGGGGHGDCVIEGNITGHDGVGLGGIFVYLLPPADAAGGDGINTGVDGHFRFGGLVPGKYLVVPANPHRAFGPKYLVVTLEAGGVAQANFVSEEVQVSYRLWGFDFNMHGDTANHFTLMHGVTVTGHMDGGEHSFTATTNADGFWEVPELPVGTYIVSSAMDGFTFEPPTIVQNIDGVTVAPPMFFKGLPNVP